MHIVHLEASLGFGGQEIRIVRESLAMMERGHRVCWVVDPASVLYEKGKELGIEVCTARFGKKHVLSAVYTIWRHLLRLSPDVVVTHSSWDAWLGGCLCLVLGVSNVRLRHLSTPIRPGWNAKVLYRVLPARVVTTCRRTAQAIETMASIPRSRRPVSIPTGIASHDYVASPSSSYFLIGTCCVFRSWKGLTTLVRSLEYLEDPLIRLVMIGDGPMRPHLQELAKELGVEGRVLFVGYQKEPLEIMRNLSVFALLSTNHEGVSQATLQAASLALPLVTTPVGGLDEVCQDQLSGIVVPPDDPKKTAEAFMMLKEDPQLARQLGLRAQTLVRNQFSWDMTMDAMEHEVYAPLADRV